MLPGVPDFKIKIWDTARWQEVSTLTGSLDELWTIAFSPDAKTLISGDKEGAIKTWNPVAQIRPPDLQKLPPDSDTNGWRFWNGKVISIDTNQGISYWNLATPRQTTRYNLPDEAAKSLSYDLTARGKMAWANHQDEIVVWDAPVQRELGRLPWVAGEGKSVSFSPNEKLLVGTAAGKCLTVWDVETLQLVANLPKSAAAVVNVGVLSFTRDLHRLAAGNMDGTVEVWDLGRKERVGEWQAHKAPVWGVALMAGGTQLVTVSMDAAAKLWDVETRRELKSFPRTMNSFWCVAISPDERRIAAGTYDGFIKIWMPSTGQEIASLKSGEDIVYGLQFLGPEGSTLVSVTGEVARYWRAPSLAEIAAVEAKKQQRAKPQ